MSNQQPESQPKQKTQRQVLPAEIESEKIVLSLMLQHPETFLPKAQQTLLRSDFFGHQAIVFAALTKLHNAGTPVSVVTLYRHLAAEGNLDKIGGPGELADLQTFTDLHRIASSPIEWEWHVKKLQEASRRRQVLNTARALTSQAETEDVDPDAAAGQFLALGKDRPANTEGSRHIRQHLLDAITHIESALDGKLAGWSTGHPALDAQIGRLRPHSYVVIGARPSIGKTSLAMDILWNVASLGQTPVAALSLETVGWNLSTRLLANVSGIPYLRIRDGRLSARESKDVYAAMERIADTSFHINSAGRIDCDQLRNQVRQWVKDLGVKVIMIDYLQLVRGSKGNEKEYDRVVEVSQTVKSLAQEFPVCLLAVCQLKRPDGGKPAKRHVPALEDLRSSGQIEQDATEALLLSEPEDAQDEASVIDLNIHIAKQKDGAKGTVALRFHRPTFRFSAAPHEEDQETASCP